MSSLEKKQLRSLRLLGKFDEELDYTEQQIKEAIGMEVDGDETINWGSAVSYVFFKFDKFNAEFKREVRENYIQEITTENNVSTTEATKCADKEIADLISLYLFTRSNIGNPFTTHYKLLQQIKDGELNEFINIDHLL